MGHLMSSVENLPGYEEIEEVGVGVMVVYHTRVGNQRQGRTTFPAMVLQQHPDDGTLELLVFFEPEDILWERRVPRWTEEQPGRCWEPVQQPAGTVNDSIAPINARLAKLEAAFSELAEVVTAPDKARDEMGLTAHERASFDASNPNDTEDSDVREEPRQKRAYTKRAKPEDGE